MSEKHTKGLLEGVARMFGHPKIEEAAGSAPEAEYNESAQTLEDLLTELSEKAEAQREAQRHREAVVSGRLSGLEKAEREEIKRERREDVHARVRADVLATHRRLGTRIDDAELTHLDEVMHELADLMATPATAGIEPYVRAAVVRRFFDETGPLAWGRLRDLMTGAKIEWPAPGEEVREHKRAEAQELFLNASPTVSADMVTGVVAVWQDHYPGPDSPLWQSVCLRAVGAGLRARMLRRGIKKVQGQRDELLVESEALLRKEISTVKQVLESGVSSVKEADQIMAGAGGLLEQVIPDLCWKCAREVITTDH